MAAVPSPAEVLAWNVSGLPTVTQNATKIADGIIKAAGTMHTTIHDFLIWEGQAKTAADGKADREQTEMRAVATAYDDLGTACTNAFRDMDHPLSEIKSIFQNYVHPPVAVADDWTVTGVKDANSEAGQQLARLSGLMTTLLAADAQWGGQITQACLEIQRMAGQKSYDAEKAAIQQIAKDDPNAISKTIADKPESFWAPDWPGLTAATIIGTKTEVTRQIMEKIASDGKNDGLLKWVENAKIKDWDTGLSRLGIFGSAIATLPSIADDIYEGHMNPTEAVVSEGGGTAVGVTVGAAATNVVTSWLAAGAGAETGAAVGAEAGSVVPVVGTVVGLGVGALVGWGVPKLIQWAW